MTKAEREELLLALIPPAKGDGYSCIHVRILTSKHGGYIARSELRGRFNMDAYFCDACFAKLCKDCYEDGGHYCQEHQHGRHQQKEAADDEQRTAGI